MEKRLPGEALDTSEIKKGVDDKWYFSIHDLYLARIICQWKQKNPWRAYYKARLCQNKNIVEMSSDVWGKYPIRMKGVDCPEPFKWLRVVTIESGDRVGKLTFHHHGSKKVQKAPELIHFISEKGCFSRMEVDHFGRHLINCALSRDDEWIPLRSSFSVKDLTTSDMIDAYRKHGIVDYQAWARKVESCEIFSDFVADALGIEHQLNAKSLKDTLIFMDIQTRTWMVPLDVPRLVHLINEAKPEQIKYRKYLPGDGLLLDNSAQDYLGLRFKKGYLTWSYDYNGKKCYSLQWDLGSARQVRGPFGEEYALMYGKSYTIEADAYYQGIPSHQWEDQTRTSSKKYKKAFRKALELFKNADQSVIVGEP
jgi:hypothetical protein